MNEKTEKIILLAINSNTIIEILKEFLMKLKKKKTILLNIKF